MTEWHPLPTAKKRPLWLTSLNTDAEKRARELEPTCLPSLDHLSKDDYDNVYEPSDDTYLLVDGLCYELQSGDLKDRIVACTVEIGCGTGVPTVYLAGELKKKKQSSGGGRAARHLVTDVNPIALVATQRTAEANGCGHSVEPVQCDLASLLLPRLENSVDVLIFNPPYVPTPDAEVGSTGIEASWAGGLHGRRVTDRALSQISKLLKRPFGIGYLITVDDNLPEELCESFSKLGLDMKPLVRRRVQNEYLTVQKLTWAGNCS